MARKNRRPKHRQAPAEASVQVLPAIRACLICGRNTRDLDAKGRCKDRLVCEARQPPLFRMD
jgi:hypothetical protein